MGGPQGGQQGRGEGCQQQEIFCQCFGNQDQTNEGLCEKSVFDGREENQK